MQDIYIDKDTAKFLAEFFRKTGIAFVALGEDFNSAAGVKNLPGRNKPLAPRKPSKRSAKGKPAKSVKSARKGTRKK